MGEGGGWAEGAWGEKETRSDGGWWQWGEWGEDLE